MELYNKIQELLKANEQIKQESIALLELAHTTLKKQNESQTAVNQYTYATARSLTSGKVTNQTLEDLKHITRFGLRNKQENTARLGETQNINLNYLTNQLHNLQALGGVITPDMQAKLLEHKLKAKYIQESKGKINLKEYDQIGKGL
ncbi:hypothetical protein [Helicobacter bizzozeronii]|uniref:hypothetical protein n=1 Tax=Helicobacter bizzozeronii TaxID=56877 RepID=UPI000CF19919|nr:hypothetical protein [Helicobacter bizzozeronii]